VNEEVTGTKTLEPGIRLARLALMVGLGYLLFATFQPFFSALIWSAVLSYGLHPLYCRLVHLTGNRRTLSAVVMSLAVTVGFILPLAYMSLLIGKELATTYLTVVTSLQQGPGLLEQWRGNSWVSILVGQYVRGAQTNHAWLSQNVTPYNETLRHVAMPESWNMSNLAGLASLDREVIRQAQFLSYLHDFQYIALVIVLLMPLILLIENPMKDKKR